MMKTIQELERAYIEAEKALDEPTKACNNADDAYGMAFVIAEEAEFDLYNASKLSDKLQGEFDLVYAAFRQAESDLDNYKRSKQ